MTDAKSEELITIPRAELIALRAEVEALKREDEQRKADILRIEQELRLKPSPLPVPTPVEDEKPAAQPQEASIALREAMQSLNIKLSSSSPLDSLMTKTDLHEAVPTDAKNPSMWLILECTDENLLKHHRKLLGIWNADKFPRESHGLLRELTAGCEWGFFKNFRSWHSHFLLRTRELEQKLNSVLEDTSESNVALLRLLIGLGVPDDGNDKKWPGWLVQFAKPAGEKLLQALAAKAVPGEAAEDVKNWPEEPRTLRVHTLPGRATVTVRPFRNEGVHTSEFFRRFGVEGAPQDSSSITNHEAVNEIVAGCPEGGAFDCQLAQNFPLDEPRGTSVTCGAEMLVYCDLLATAKVVKAFTDEALAAALAGSACTLAPAPLKDAMRLVAKGKAYWSGWKGGMTNLTDCVRYTVTVPSMTRTREAMELIERGLGGAATLEEVTNKMHTNYKAVFANYAVSLTAVAKPHPFWAQALQSGEISPAHTFMFEVQITTVQYSVINKYSHVLFEVAREKGPGLAFYDLNNSLRPLGWTKLW